MCLTDKYRLGGVEMHSPKKVPAISAIHLSKIWLNTPATIELTDSKIASRLVFLSLLIYLVFPFVDSCA